AQWRGWPLPRHGRLARICRTFLDVAPDRILFAEGKAARDAPALPRRHGRRRAACAGSAHKLPLAWRRKHSQCVHSPSETRVLAKARASLAFRPWGLPEEREVGDHAGGLSRCPRLVYM